MPVPAKFFDEKSLELESLEQVASFWDVQLCHCSSSSPAFGTESQDSAEKCGTLRVRAQKTDETFLLEVSVSGESLAKLSLAHNDKANGVAQ